MGGADVHTPKGSLQHLKRSLATLDPVHEPTSQRRRSLSPVSNWLNDTAVTSTGRQSAPAVLRSSEVPRVIYDRPSSVPANLDRHNISPIVEDLSEIYASSAPLSEMGDRRDRNREDRISESSTTTTFREIEASSTAYQEVLEYNNVYIDRTGLEMSPDVREFVNNIILTNMTSSPLPLDWLKQTVKDMEKWGNTGEGIITNFATTLMWPVYNSGIGLGGQNTWARDALPFEPTWGYPLSKPAPDHIVGYARGRKSGFSPEEMHAASHSVARPYTQPANGPFMPFLIAELKPNVTGGSMWHAQNQAAGSGTYCVRALEWLFDQAKISTTETDTLSFSLTANGSVVMLSVHWYSKEDQAYHMSHIKGFIPTETRGIQECHNAVENIVKWSLGTRHKKVKEALEMLFPQPEHWATDNV